MVGIRKAEIEKIFFLSGCLFFYALVFVSFNFLENSNDFKEEIGKFGIAARLLYDRGRKAFKSITYSLKTLSLDLAT